MAEACFCIERETVLIWCQSNFLVMAKQSGIIKLEGTIGDISFYKSKDGFLARGKGGIDKDRIKNDPAFQRTRENGSEFGRAGVASSTLRTAFRPILVNTTDSRISSRLVTEMLKVIKADQTNTRGERNVLDGELEMLTGFEFNQKSSLSSTLYAPFTATIDRVTGAAVVNIPAFAAEKSLVPPKGATHFKFISAASEVNFTDGTFKTVTADSAELAIGAGMVAATELSNALTPASTQPLFLLFGIEFYQQVNGVLYPLNNGTYNALSIVVVDGIND